MKTILLFKATPTDASENSFEIMLKEDFNVICVKTLDFEYKNLQTLKICLDTPEKYSGIIFTSPRCVTGVQNALNGNMLHAQWKTKMNYGVGPKTVASALYSFGLHCLGAEAGNANSLGNIILQNEDELPLLYPKGNLAKDTLNLKVTNTEEIIIYETLTSQTIEYDLRVATNNFKVCAEYIVFFSPSGVKAIVPYLPKLNHAQLKVIAIGPTTKASLEEFNIPVTGTCVKPSAQDLVSLITSIDKL